jgi:putative SOS response-associated peptidase YedK
MKRGARANLVQNFTAPPAAQIAAAFGIPFDALRPRDDIRPGQMILAVRRALDASRRELAILHWGLVPHWTSDPSKFVGGRGLEFARAEGIDTKPAFRDAFRRRRCLIPADSFYEFKRAGTSATRGRRIPYRVRMTDGHVFAMGGVWDRWHDPQTHQTLESCAIITTAANAVVEPLHDRMPLIVAPSDYDRWLDPSTSLLDATAMLRPAPAEWLVAEPANAAITPQEPTRAAG